MRGLRGVRLALAGWLVIGLAAAAGDAGTTEAAFTARTGAPASSFSARSFFGPRLVRTLAATGCGMTSTSIVVPAGGIPAGDVVVIAVALDGGPGGVVGATDPAGNVYSRRVESLNEAVTLVSSRLATGLAAGQVITVTFPQHDTVGVLGVQITQVQPPHVDVTAAASNMSTQPTVSLTTTNKRDALIGVAANKQVATYTPAPGWTELTPILGCGMLNASMHVAYRDHRPAGPATFDPTFSGGQQQWGAAVMAIRG